MPSNEGVGICIDGLCDSFGSNSELRQVFLADALLLSGREILTLEAAEQVRHASGVPWPPEGQISETTLPCRLPVSWAWRLLCEAETRPAYWKPAGEYEVRVEEAIAAHIDSLVCNWGISKGYLAIPDTLSEFGQEWLLRALKRRLRSLPANAIEFVWRPIAAALALLGSSSFNARAVTTKDFVLVVHLGADALEISTFPLRTEQDQNGIYAVPVRDLPPANIRASGCDLASAWLAQKLSPDPDLSGWWQGFTGMEETWKGLCGEEIVSSDCVPWWRENLGWRNWQVKPEDFETALDLPVERISFLVRLGGHELNARCNWAQYIEEQVRIALGRRIPSGCLVGIVISGRLLTKQVEAIVLKACRDLIPDSLCPEILSRQHILVATRDFNPIAVGAQQYADRLQQKRTGYFDRVEGLSVWAQGASGMEWKPLIRNLEVKGGITPAPQRSDTEFLLARGSIDLELFVRRGDEGAPIRRATTTFPFRPQHDVRLTTVTTVGSARGLAHIEFVPDDKSFLGGTRVFFDFERMKEAAADDLPHPGGGYQMELLQISASGLEERWHSYKFPLDRWFAVKPSAGNYLELDKKVRSVIRGGSYTRAVDQDGRAENPKAQEMVNNFVQKIKRDIELCLRGKADAKVLDALLVTSAWLYAVVPAEALEVFRDRLRKKTLLKKWHIEAVGRIFVHKADISLLFSSAMNPDPPKKNLPAWLKAVGDVLSLRAGAIDSLTRQQADFFFLQAAEVMRAEIGKQKVRLTFLNMLLLVQAILRFRHIERDWPSESHVGSMLTILREALSELARNPPSQGALRAALVEAIPAVADYLNHHGTKNVLRIIDAAIDETDSDSNMEDE